MKRTAPIIAVLVVLLIPSSALAEVFYKGALSSPSAVVEFRVKFHNGGPRKVTKMSYANVPYSGGCVAAISDDLKVSWKVNGKRKFRGKAVDSFGRTVKAKGTFKRHDKKIVGTFSVAKSPCDTGDVSYGAKRGG